MNSVIKSAKINENLTTSYPWHGDKVSFAPSDMTMLPNFIALTHILSFKASLTILGSILEVANIGDNLIVIDKLFSSSDSSFI